MPSSGEDTYIQILRHGPSQSTLLIVLTKMREQGRYQEVIEECLKALEKYPDDIRLRRLLAESYSELGFIEEARSELERLTSEIEDLNSVYKLQANVYARQSRTKEASEALKRYLVHNPHDKEAVNLLNQVNEQQEQLAPSSEETSAPPEEVKTSPNLATPTLAEIYYNQGEIQKAIKTYQEVLSRTPEDKASLRRLKELKRSAYQTAPWDMASQETSEQKKRQIINTLEAWLNKIQEINRAA